MSTCPPASELHCHLKVCNAFQSGWGVLLALPPSRWRREGFGSKILLQDPRSQLRGVEENESENGMNQIPIGTSSLRHHLHPSSHPLSGSSQENPESENLNTYLLGVFLQL